MMFGSKETIEELRLTDNEREVLANMGSLPKAAKALMRSDPDLIVVQTAACRKLTAQIRAEADLRKAVKENLLLAQDLEEIESGKSDPAELRRRVLELERKNFALTRANAEYLEAAKHEHERSLQLQAGASQ